VTAGDRLYEQIRAREARLAEARDLLLARGDHSVPEVREHLRAWAHEILDAGSEGDGKFIVSTADHDRVARIREVLNAT
jgi:hypothetical protein